MSVILETLKRTIAEANVSRYRIAKESGVEASALARLMSGERGLSIEAAERVADVLDLEIIIRPKRRRKES